MLKIFDEESVAENILMIIRLLRNLFNSIKDSY